MVSTTRPISCLTERSRSGVARVPRKYLETTMFVACCDQKRGISTSRCSKTTEPFSLPMTADRMSHSISSNGSIPSLAKKRSYSSPGANTGGAGRVEVCGLVVSVWLVEPTAAFCIIPPNVESPTSPGPRDSKACCVLNALHIYGSWEAPVVDATGGHQYGPL